MPVLAALLIAALAWGPDLMLKVLLSRLSSSEQVTLSYERAEAGLFFRSVAIDRLTVAAGDGFKLSAEYLGLTRPSFFNLTRLIRNPRQEASEPLILAGGAEIRGLRLSAPREQLKLDFLELRRPAYQPRSDAPGTALFDKLEARSLNFDSRPELRLVVSRLEARSLSPDSLGSLRLEGLEAAAANDRLDLSGLALGGLPLGGLARAANFRETLTAALWALANCESLELAPTVLTKGGREALNISGTLSGAPNRSGPAVNIYRLDFTADPDVLVKGWDRPDRRIFREIFGSRPALSLECQLNLNQGSAEFTIDRLQSPDLGNLSASLRLSGLGPRSDGPPRKLSNLLMRALRWRLDSLELAFADQGLTAKLSRALGQSSPEQLMDRYLEPLARKLEAKRVPANLPVLLSEARAFLERPESLKITAAPPKPLPIMSLAKRVRYDIIEKLHLTAQVNDRAPVAVAAGAFQERLPNAPRPMEDIFEEDIQ